MSDSFCSKTGASVSDLSIPSQHNSAKYEFTDLQGQYLAFIRSYTKLHRVAPAEDQTDGRDLDASHVECSSATRCERLTSTHDRQNRAAAPTSTPATGRPHSATVLAPMPRSTAPNVAPSEAPARSDKRSWRSHRNAAAAPAAH